MDVRDARGFTLIELLVVIVIVGVLLTIAMANYRVARISGAEASAIGALSAINQAQFAYTQTCGHQKFAPHLTTLGKPNPATSVAYLSPDLTSAEAVDKSGYQIAMAGPAVADAILTCTGDTPLEGYHVTADPVLPGVTGNRFFATNGDRVIYQNTESFEGKMPENGAPPSGQEIRAASR